ncbi:hypothetical protein TBLA_0F01170 [Henningerozyma blattae CBS 6284]|uniref:2,5-diamino-6-ribosylamino-4(3H)-pyrimidinone 5'-phosphate reductase n=1 Tax=Henningerozyma blattae (strain ATCC 34711 / CBS 6284 / DSM 70876 / NBRC 10599 / NRRL Y-10934 / UCD 77-7) TaxID=1071380 RepID=I2H5K8_HENB6|nr:hypothetical protein TBLA_0F01170 [Tetrapisispora blattae CBS 6284]CCH61660.1 hypothetical protein TBLA_0F01170 [Tetrapisispora blattae CBS 6284]
MSLTPLRKEFPLFLKPYLPNESIRTDDRPFITLTYAQSLDSRISKGKGIRTTISHLETKTMTHYLRLHHDGILIGSGTITADNPGLNCKIDEEKIQMNSPRPIIIDPNQNWNFKDSKIEELYLKNQGKSPIVFIKENADIKYPNENVNYERLKFNKDGFNWIDIFELLSKKYQMKSIMIEGGANVINRLLMKPELIDSLIITIGSVYLGKNGVEVSPSKALKLKDVNWWKGTTDSVMCARIDSIDD